MMVKKFMIFLISLFSFILPVFGIEFDLSSKNAILYNLDEDKVLYEKNSEEKIAIASMTKIMTAIVALENINDLNQKVILTNQDFLVLVEANASVAGFKVGQRVTYQDLLYGLLLPSGADAAQALVNNIAGSRAKFVAMMNQKAEELGMTNTHFANETGLDNEEAYSTVKDVVTMFKYALSQAKLKEIISAKTYTMSDNSFSVMSTTKQSIQNSKLNLDYVIGGKTGTTKRAGKCLVSLASYNNSNYILVTARANSNSYANIEDAKEIYDYFMANYGIIKVLDKGDLILSLKTKNLKPAQVNFYATEAISKYLPKSFTKDSLVYDYEGKDMITSQNEKGEKLGVLKIKYNEETLATLDIVLQDNLKLDYFKIYQSFKLEIWGSLILIIILIFFFKSKRRKVKRF